MPLTYAPFQIVALVILENIYTSHRLFPSATPLSGGVVE